MPKKLLIGERFIVLQNLLKLETLLNGGNNKYKCGKYWFWFWCKCEMDLADSKYYSRWGIILFKMADNEKKMADNIIYDCG